MLNLEVLADMNIMNENVKVKLKIFSIWNMYLFEFGSRYTFQRLVNIDKYSNILILKLEVFTS